MPQVTVKLDAVLDSHIQDAIERGETKSRDRYIEDALRDRYLHDLQRQKLHESLDRAIADADAGRVTPLEEAFDRILSDLEK
jgi:antitoxin ParD1/3/4